MNRRIVALFAIVAACASSAALGSDFALTGDLGTTGLGLHLSTPLQPNLNARFGLNYAKYKYTTSTANMKYDFNLKLNTFDALLDYFPTDNAFRLSGGLVYNNNKIEAVGLPTAAGTYTVNGNVYTAASAGQLNGNADFHKVAPYLGLGWGNAVHKLGGWGFSADLGVLFQGSSNTSLSNSGCTADAATCAQLGTDVAAENARLQEKADNLRLYPVVRIGASYRF